MPTFTTLTLEDVTSERKFQVFDEFSAIERSEEVKNLTLQTQNDGTNDETWMNLGLALAKQKLYREAIAAFSRAISLAPFKGIIYRHRGHRLLSIHRFEEALADLSTASRLDCENWDIWYHLGLAYYLVGDYKGADYAYTNCIRVTDSTDKLVAVLDWYWMVLMRLGKPDEANALLNQIDKDTYYGENYSYYRRLLLYKGEVSPDGFVDFEGAPFPALELATQGYGLANYYYVNGHKEKAGKLLRDIVEAAGADMWSAFGYLAALVDLKNGF